MSQTTLLIEPVCASSQPEVNPDARVTASSSGATVSTRPKQGSIIRVRSILSTIYHFELIVIL